MTPKLKPTKAPRAPNHNTRILSIVTKVSARERAHVVGLAKKYTGGNVSEFIRYAVFNFGMSK